MHNEENNINRAHIFQSFDALKGFREILKEQERIIVPKKILSEDDLEILNRKIAYIQQGMVITIIYFDQSQYVQIEGIVTKINFDTKIIQIVKHKINFYSIIEIKGNDAFEDFI